MSFEIDEEILQDFLVEAGEILELLQEQLVALESSPNDSELLNAIFRGFHTVKGGAGFLGLGPMVDMCHEAENTFDLLRTDQINVSSELMDVILRVLDAINGMYEETQAGEEQSAADAALLAQLKLFSVESNASPVEPSSASQEPEIGIDVPENNIETANEQQEVNANIDEIDDTEFEELLDALHGSKASVEAESEADISGDITDDEFESLLDDLHGSGKFAVTPAASESIDNTNISANNDAEKPASDDISEDEFDKLLDELHGVGGAPTAKAKNDSLAHSTPSPQTASSASSVGAAQVKQATKVEVKAAKTVKPAQAETTVRVDTARLDDIMNMVGELVLVRNRLLSLGVSHDNEEMSKTLANLDLVTGDLQGAVMKTRMQPIKKVFGRFPRVVRDLARSLEKEINLVMTGEDTDLDKNLVEALADPLVHLVRNSVDHGIEMPSVREASGKSRVGTITLSASQEGDHILLKIEDDGAGMDANKLKDIAISRGVLDHDSAARMSDEEAYNLIFAPGFSTKEQISDISGRGVGMDVVKTRISQLNGTVNISSSKGKGTCLYIKVPLTLAIMPTLMVEVSKQVFALPLSNVNEIFRLDLNNTNVVDGQLTVIVRKKAIPLFYLDKWLSRSLGSRQTADANAEKALGHVVVVQLGMLKVGFVVDDLIGQEEVVIKPLGTLLHGTPGMSGATITSDGGIALILDVPNLLNHYARNNR